MFCLCFHIFVVYMFSHCCTCFMLACFTFVPVLLLPPPRGPLGEKRSTPTPQTPPAQNNINYRKSHVHEKRLSRKDAPRHFVVDTSLLGSERVFWAEIWPCLTF